MSEKSPKQQKLLSSYFRYNLIQKDITKCYDSSIVYVFLFKNGKKILIYSSTSLQETSASADVQSMEAQTSSIVGSETASTEYDPSDLVGYNRDSLTDAVKLEILPSSWEVPLGYQFPSRSFGKRDHHFQPKWLSKWPFLRYSKSTDGVFCSYCFVFRTNDTGNLISNPLSDWKNIFSLIEKHIHTTGHSIAADNFSDFIKVATGKESDIVRQIPDVVDRQPVETILY